MRSLPLEPDPLIREALAQEASFWEGEVDLAVEPGTSSWPTGRN